MVSNYGDYGRTMEFGAIRVKALYPATAFREENTQTVSLITLNGALYVTQTSRNPLTELLARAHNILLSATTEVL